MVSPFFEKSARFCVKIDPNVPFNPLVSTFDLFPWPRITVMNHDSFLIYSNCIFLPKLVKYSRKSRVWSDFARFWDYSSNAFSLWRNSKWRKSIVARLGLSHFWLFLLFALLRTSLTVCSTVTGFDWIILKLLIFRGKDAARWIDLVEYRKQSKNWKKNAFYFMVFRISARLKRLPGLRELPSSAEMNII